MTHRVRISLPSSSATTMILGATAAAAGYVGAKIIFEQPPQPEPAYHPAHELHDPIGGLVYASLAGAALGAVAHKAFGYLRGID